MSIYQEISELLNKKISSIQKLKSEFRLENVAWFESLISMIQRLNAHISIMEENPSEGQVKHYEENINSIAQHRMYINMYDSCYFRQDVLDKLYELLYKLKDSSCNVCIDTKG